MAQLEHIEATFQRILRQEQAKLEKEQTLLALAADKGKGCGK